MLAVVESFGGFVKERRSLVHIVEDVSNKVSVIVRTAARDPKTDRVKYSVFDSFDVAGADPKDVYAAAKEGVLRASNSSKK